MADLFPNLDTLRVDLIADSTAAAVDARALVDSVASASTTAEARSALREMIASWLGEQS